jgi:hypothetical protein
MTPRAPRIAVLLAARNRAEVPRRTSRTWLRQQVHHVQQFDGGMCGGQAGGTFSIFAKCCKDGYDRC